MSILALRRSPGPVYPDLPPTLQPSAVLAAAPPSETLRSAALASLVYLLIGAAAVAASTLVKPVVIPSPPLPPAGPTIIFEPWVRPAVLVQLPSTQSSAKGSEGPLVQQPAVTAVRPDPTEPASGLPTENHRLDPPPIGVRSSGPAQPTAPSTGPGTGMAAPTVRDFTMTGLAVLHRVEPLYPDIARRARVQGAVVLLMTVDDQGLPTEVKVLEGPLVLQEVAMRAARQWRFEPARMEGRPVPASFRLTLNFSLR